MFLPDLVVRSQRVVTPRGTRPAAVHIRHGKILGILDFDEVLPGSPLEDVDGAVLPGIVDPSIARDLDGTREVADGGITTMIVREAASETRFVDVAVWDDSLPTRIASAATVDDLEPLISAARSGTRTHLMRVASWEMLTPIFNAQRARIPLTAGTTVLDLTACATETERRNREYFWAALANGLIQTVSSCGLTPPQSVLPTVWRAAIARGCTLEQIAGWMCRAPAKLAGLTRKGEIEPGFDADIVLFDPDAALVERTYLRGVPVDAVPRGEFLHPAAN